MRPVLRPVSLIRARERAFPMALPFSLRASAIHGRGGYATRLIPAGTRIGEYAGERIARDEADRRYAARQVNVEPVPEYTFALDDDTVIDGLAGGNDTAFINHSCEPNCRFVREGDRVFVDAIHDIPEGAELTLDYKLRTRVPVPPEAMSMFACRCGAPTCRGSMLKIIDDPRPAASV